MDLLSKQLAMPPARFKGVAVYEQGAVASKGKTRRATLLMQIQILF